MRYIFSSIVFIFSIIFFSPNHGLAQNDDCNSFVDPLVSDPFQDDPCCGAYISENVCYQIEGLDFCSDDLEWILQQFTYPGGTWEGELYGNGHEIAAHMTAEAGGTTQFVFDAASSSICAEGVDNTEFGDLVFGDCFTGQKVIFTPNVETVNDCPVQQPSVEDMLSNDAPNNQTLFPGWMNLETNDFTQNYDASQGGPTENQVGNMINAVVNSGVFQDGLGCSALNLNCYPDSILSSIYSTEFEATLEEVFIENGDEFGLDIPAGWEVADVQNELSNSLQTAFADLGPDGLAGFINGALGINFPTGDCEEIQPLQTGTAGMAGKENPNNLLKSVSKTAADFDFLAEELPGLGAGGEISAPSPTAMQMIQNVESGVNLYNGAQSNSIPLHALVANDITVPITLSSSNNGLKVNDLGTTVGQHWNLNAGGMVSRVVKGLPDDYKGTVTGMGVGSVQELTPRMDVPHNVGIKLVFLGDDALNGACNDPLQKINYGIASAESLPVVTVRWLPLEPNFVNINIEIPYFYFLGVQIKLVFGIKVGVAPSDQLGNVIYEEAGRGFLYAGNETEMQEFAELSALTDSYLEGIPTEDQAKYLRLIHPVVQDADRRFFNSLYDSFINWGDAIDNLFGGSPTYESRRLDVEADEFYFTAGPHSGKFTFNLAGEPVIYPYMPGVKVRYTTNAEGELTTFTISTPEGLDYTYGNADGYTAIDKMTNINYSLPNYYTYPEAEVSAPSLPDRTEYTEARIDVGVLHKPTFIGPSKVVTYGETYNRNFKIMDSPPYASAWHLVAITSNITQEVVNLSYEPKLVTYYADRSYSHTFPNFGLSPVTGNLKTLYSLHLNPLHLAATKWQNGRADFTYNATETSLLRWDINNISGRGERIEFDYALGRGEIHNDHLLETIKVYRNELLYKGWQLNYDITDETITVNCDGYDVNGPPPVSIDGDEETVFVLGSDYDIHWFEYNLYTHISLDVACLRKMIRIPIAFYAGVQEKGYRQEMGEFGSLMEIKGLPDPFDTEKYGLDLPLEKAIYEAESNRSFLSAIKIIDQEEAILDEFIESIDYFEGDLPKRFSTQQDLFGYCNDNSVSGSPLPAVSYTSSIQPTVSLDVANTPKLKQHFPFYNKASGADNFYQGQQEAGNLSFAQRGALQSIRMATGGAISYAYELNELPSSLSLHSNDPAFSGNLGAGLRVVRKVEDPGDTPAKTTTYQYSEPSYINAPIRFWQKPTNHYFPGDEERIVSTSHYQNMVLPNKGSFIGYTTATESWEGIGQTIHVFSTPDNYLDLADKLQIELDPAANERFSCLQEVALKPDNFTYDVLDEASCLSNLDPALNIEDIHNFCDLLLGLEVTTIVQDAGGRNVSTRDNYYETYTGGEITSGPTQFRTVMNQTNDPGTFLEAYSFRQVQNYVPYGNGTLGTLTSYLASLLFDIGGPFNGHPYKRINRYYQTTTRQLPLCNIRLDATATRNSFGEGGGDNFVETDMIYFYDDDYDFGELNTASLNLVGREDLVARTSSNTSDNIRTITDYRYAFVNEENPVDNVLADYFDSDAIDLLNEHNFLAPVYTKTEVNGTLTDHSFTALSLHDGNKIAPKADYGLQNGILRLRGKYADYNDDARPGEYYKAKYLATYDSPTEDFFDVIELSWTPQLQLLEKKYLPSDGGTTAEFKTAYFYSTFFEYAGQRDVNGVTTTYEYDKQARLKQVSEDSGLRVTEYTYQIGPGENALLSDIVIQGQTTQHHAQNVDGFGKTKSLVRLNDGAVLNTATYDNFWRAIETSELRSGVVFNTYEASPASRLLETLDAEGNIFSFGYQGGGDGGSFFYKTSVTDPNGHTTHKYFNSLEQILFLAQPEGATTAYSYDDLLRLETILNPIGELYTYSYNDMGRLYAKAIPLGGTTRYWYDEKYRMVATSDGNGDQAIYEYDGFDRTVNAYLNHPGVVLGNEGIVLDYASMVSAYDPAFLLSQQEYRGDNTLYLESRRDLILSANSSGGFVDTEYEDIDVLGRPTNATSIYPVGTVESLVSYDGLGNVLNTSDIVQHNGQEMNVTNTFQFDDVIRASGHMVGVNGLGAQVNKLIYDPQDRLVVKLVGDIADSEETLQQVDYYYDDIGRIIAINSFGGYECNVGEMVCQQSLEMSLTNANFTDYHCVAIDEVNIGGNVYAPAGNFTGNGPEDYGLYVVQVLEDALHELGHIGEVSQENWLSTGGFTFLFTIDNTDAFDIELTFELCEKEFSFVQGECCETLPSGGGGAFGENHALVGANGGRNPDLYYQSMEYDGLDISQIEIGSECSYGRMINNYTYDGLHRVRNMDNILFTPDPIGAAFSTEYTYDPAGNIQTLLRNGFAGMNGQGEPQFEQIDKLIYTYPDQDSKLGSVEDMVSDPAHQAFGFSEPLATYDYDSNGNMGEAGPNGYEYNILNLPQLMSTPDATIYQDYVSSGQKYKKETQSATPETRYYLGGVEWVDGLPKVYNFGDGRIYWEDPTPNGEQEVHIQYRLTDHLGNTMVFFEDKDEDGFLITELDAPSDPEDLEVIQRLWYYPFGMDMEGIGQATATPDQAYRYNGKELDQATGLYDYGARYYDPAIARWGQVDPLADQYAPYSPYNYVLGNPIRLIDPDGMAPDDIIYLTSAGKVSRIERTDSEQHTFIIEETSQVLHFNDLEGLDRDRASQNYEVGDRVFFNISNEELTSAVEAAGDGNWLNVVFKSHGKADFLMSHLVPNYFGRDGTGDEAVYLEDGVLRTHYVENQHYFQFGDDFRLFNLYDAGNFMWGAWMNYSGFSPSEAKFGSEANELFMDADADQRALKAGQMHFENIEDE